MGKVLKVFIASIFIFILLFSFLTDNAFADASILSKTTSEYTVKYVDKDKSGIAPESSGIGYVGQVITVSAIGIKGYTLATDSPKSITLSSDSDNNIIVYIYDCTQYTITYELNGGSVSTANPGSYTIISDPIVLNNPRRSGYIFSGWTGTDLSASTKYVTISSGSTGNRAYTANWSDPVTYSIAYDLSGGTLSGTNPGTYNVLSDDIKLINPQKSGYKFEGWSGTRISGKSLSVTIPKGSYGNRAYTANWSEPVTYTITYDLNGGTLSGSNPKTYSVESADRKLINPEKTGYTFTGWSGTGIEGRSANVTITRGSAGNRAYTANWSTNNYTVKFVIGTNGTTAGKTTFEGLHYGDSTPEPPTLQANDGWAFTGWSPEVVATVTDDATYSAQYTVQTFTVKFIDFDGTVLSAQSVNWGMGATAPASPSRDGYTFTGWDKPFDSIKGDIIITALYGDNSAVSSAGSSPSSSGGVAIQHEQTPSTGRVGNTFDWLWLLLAIPVILLIWILMNIWFSVIPIAENVFDNGDGTFTVQWGYMNRKHRRYAVDKRKSVVLAFTGKIINGRYEAPAKFLKGRVRNVFSTVVDGDAYVEWKIKSRKAAVDISKLDI